MTYATRQLRADEPFEAADRGQARLLAALGRAKLVEAKPSEEAREDKPGGSPPGNRAPRRGRKPAPHADSED